VQAVHQVRADAGNDVAQVTDQLVRRLPFTARGQAKVRDEECKGLLLVIGMDTKTFSAKVERVIDGFREYGYASFGSFDPDASDHVGVKDARKAAAKWIADYKNGAKVAAKRGGTTLKEAWARYKARLEAKGRSPTTIEWYREYIEDGPLKEWLDTQLVSITPERAAALHTRATRKHGPYRANGAMRTLRAVYNYAKLKVDRALPQIDVTMLVEWNAEKRRNTGMGLGRLPAWGRQLAALENPVRREFHLLCLLSGSRPDALSKGEWGHVSVARRVFTCRRQRGAMSGPSTFPFPGQCSTALCALAAPAAFSTAIRRSASSSPRCRKRATSLNGVRSARPSPSSVPTSGNRSRQ
jgi:hypothetical protein